MNENRKQSLNKKGRRIRDLRLLNNLTQSELAEKLNLKESNIIDFEERYGSLHLDTANKMAKLFNVSIEYLMNLSDEKLTYEPKELITKEEYTEIEEELDKILSSLIPYTSENGTEHHAVGKGIFIDGNIESEEDVNCLRNSLRKGMEFAIFKNKAHENK